MPSSHGPRTAEEWAEKLQPEVAYCYNCQARESGEWIWVLGNREEMEELLADSGVPEALWKDVAEELSCLNCGTQLDLGCAIGRKTSEELHWDAVYEEWRVRYAPQLADFVAWISKHPYLGLDHALGRQFMQEIPRSPRRSFDKATIWYRARAVWGPDVPTSVEMGPPAEAPGSEGRFNHHGQTVFYLAADRETAAAEAIGRSRGIVWVQEFSINPLGELLDLNSVTYPDIAGVPILIAGMNWTDAHTLPASESSEWKPEYFLPRYIADCARAAGCKGIVYTSTRFLGECLVLFDWSRSSISANGEPALFEWNAEVAEKQLPF